MSRKNLILGGILVALIAFAYLYQGPFDDWKKNLGKPQNFLAKINVDEIDKIEIVVGEQNTILERNEKRWKVSGTKNFYVKENIALTLNNALKESIKSDFELASENKDKKKDFLVDESGIDVKFFKGDALLSNFIIGKMAFDYESSYISKSEIDETYRIKTDLYSAFSVSEWRDNTIFSSEKEKINKIRFQYPDREFIVEKNNEEWTGTAPSKFSVNKEKIEKILGLMSNLTAAKIPGQKFENTGLEKNLMIVAASGEGIDNVIMIGEDNGEKFYYAKRGDSDNIYLITEDQMNEFNKKITDLK